MEHLVSNIFTISHAMARQNPVSVTYTAPLSCYMWQRTVSMQTSKEYASEKRLKHMRCVSACVCVCVCELQALPHHLDPCHGYE